MNFDWRYLLLPLLLVGCNDKLDIYHESVAAAELGIDSVSLTPESIVLSRNESRQMTFTATLDNGSTYPLNDKAIWRTGNAAIATVDGQGLVTATGDGSTWVSARFAQFSAQRTILVNTADLVTLNIEGNDSISVCRPASYSLSGQFSDGSERPIEANTANWSLAPATAGTIDNSGKLTVTSAGVASVQLGATRNSISATKPVAVVHDLTRIALTSTSLSVEVGGSIRPTASAVYQDGSQTDVASIAKWTSSLPAIAKVDPSGRIEGVTVGSTTIEVSCGGISSAITVTVVPSAEVSALEIENGQAEIKVNKGATLTLDATAIYTTGRRSSVTADADWSVEVIKGGPISVSNDKGSKGEVDTRNAGEAFVKATFNNQTAYIKVIIQ